MPLPQGVMSVTVSVAMLHGTCSSTASGVAELPYLVLEYILNMLVVGETHKI